MHPWSFGVVRASENEAVYGIAGHQTLFVEQVVSQEAIGTSQADRLLANLEIALTCRSKVPPPSLYQKLLLSWCVAGVTPPPRNIDGVCRRVASLILHTRS